MLRYMVSLSGGQSRVGRAYSCKTDKESFHEFNSIGVRIVSLCLSISMHQLTVIITYLIYFFTKSINSIINNLSSHFYIHLSCFVKIVKARSKEEENKNEEGKEAHTYGC